MPILLTIWNYLSWQTKIALLFLVVGFVGFGYFYYEKSAEKREAEKQLNQFIEGQAQKDAQRIEKQKAEVNQAQSEVNAVKNANYSNVNNDELRRRIIEGAKNIK